MLKRKTAIIVIASLVLLVTYTLTNKGGFVSGVQQKSKCLFDDAAHTSKHTSNTYGRITNKVAVITDNKYTSQLIPLILHFHAVLGPDWPIVFYTSEDLAQHLSNESRNISATWRHAIDDRRVSIRTVPNEFNLTSRYGVNQYLSRPWLWEQLAPAQNVLVFQADSILCSNSQYKVDDFLEWDFIGALMRPDLQMNNIPLSYNGGLSLRNRTMMLDILREENSWEETYNRSNATMGGEDVWFSNKMAQRGAHLPEHDATLQFALQYKWDFNAEARPLGYHKVHRNVPRELPSIAKWCPEITLAAAGTLNAP